MCYTTMSAGTHVSNTAEIGAFKVVSEGGVASGVRRIEAVAGQAAVEYLQSLDAIVKQLAGNFRVKAEELPARVSALQVCYLTGTLSVGLVALEPSRHIACPHCVRHATSRDTLSKRLTQREQLSSLNLLAPSIVLCVCHVRVATRMSSRQLPSSWARPRHSLGQQRPW